MNQAARADEVSVARVVSRGRLGTGLVAVLVLGSFTTGSWWVGDQWGDDQRARQRRDQERVADDVAVATATAVRRAVALTDEAAIQISVHEGLDDQRFHAWLDAEVATGRFPGILGVGIVEPVPAADLEEWLAREVAEQAAYLDATPTVFPPGQRDVYCLAAAGAATHEYVPIERRFGRFVDYCSAQLAVSPLFARATDSGAFIVSPLPDAAVQVIELPGTPVSVARAIYRDGTIPADVASRRTALVGWVTAIFDADRMVDVVRDDVAVRLHRTDELSGDVLIAAVGVADEGLTWASRTVVGDGGHWRVEVGVPSSDGGLAPSTQGRIITALGLVLTLLFGIVMRVLSLSRSRALRLVAEKTEELRHQALHDGLTGLPNRRLLSDRLDVALARARRDGQNPATLFIDLDGFKAVNDTWGHGAGDELLLGIAQRFRECVREEDAVARFGGDEFVVLTSAKHALGVAARILEVVRPPIALETAGGASVSVTASVGIAAGPCPSADALLRDADVALYRAKQAGRDRAVVFDEGTLLAPA